LGLWIQPSKSLNGAMHLKGLSMEWF